jgi:hypothetical protein
VIAAVEEDQVAHARPDDRRVALDRGDARRGRIMADDQLAAALGMVGAEEHTAHRVGIDVGLESHLRAPLHVKEDTVAVISRRDDGFRPYLVNELQELGAVKLVQPGELRSHLGGMGAAPGNRCNLCGLTR